MAARGEPTAAELRRRWLAEKERNKLSQRRSRARQRDGQPDASGQPDAVSVTAPLAPSLPSEVSPPEVPPQTPSPSPPLPPPLSPPLPPSTALAKRNGHADVVRAQPVGRPRDLIWDALADIFGEPSTLSERSSRNAACHDFRQGARRVGLSDAEQAERIRTAHDNYFDRMPADAAETPFALAKHLSALVRPVAPRGPRVRQEVVQRFTTYGSRRVERSFTEAVDEAEREVGE